MLFLDLRKSINRLMNQFMESTQTHRTPDKVTPRQAAVRDALSLFGQTRNEQAERLGLKRSAAQSMINKAQISSHAFIVFLSAHIAAGRKLNTALFTMSEPANRRFLKTFSDHVEFVELDHDA